MKIRAGYEIGFDCAQPTPILLMLNVHPSRAGDLITPDVMTVSPSAPARQYQDSFGNICTRIVAMPGGCTVSADFVISDTGLADERAPNAIQHPVEELPDDVLMYLLASRYCDTELLSDEAWRLFSGTPLGWGRVQAICDHVHQRIAFGYQHARATRTAAEGHRERIGVCRDFAHLAITLCRCMNIPARYCTGYLGDFGIVAVDEPMDFSAWFQAYLGGRWHTFDARHNFPRIGRVLIAAGRDATDVAISTSFGACGLANFTVIAEEVVEDSPPIAKSA